MIVMTFTPRHLSSIPQTTDYLYNLFSSSYKTDTNNQPVMVWFGTELGVWSTPITIEINGIEPVLREWATLGPDYQIEEDYSIRCKITSWSGESFSDPTSAAQNFLNVKNDVFTAWFALEAAVANDPSLGQNVRVAWFDEMNYAPTTDGSGHACGTITWAVRCQVRVSTL